MIAVTASMVYSFSGSLIYYIPSLAQYNLGSPRISVIDIDSTATSGEPQSIGSTES
jgi:hypothetical protein